MLSLLGLLRVWGCSAGLPDQLCYRLFGSALPFFIKDRYIWTPLSLMTLKSPLGPLSMASGLFGKQSWLYCLLMFPLFFLNLGVTFVWGVLMVGTYVKFCHFGRRPKVGGRTSFFDASRGIRFWCSHWSTIGPIAVSQLDDLVLALASDKSGLSMLLS